MNISHIILKISSKISSLYRGMMLACVLFLCPLNSAGSENSIDFLRITSNSGLSSEEIRSIHQDHEGYMWFLTPNGLNKYDGYNFKIYKKNSGEIEFPASAFECVCEGPDKRIWLGTVEQGVLIFDPHTNELLQFNELIPGNPLAEKSIRSLLCDRNGNIWIGTENGLYLYYTQEGLIQYYNLVDLENPQAEWCIIEDLLEDDKGNIWIATWNEGLFVFDAYIKAFRNYKIFDAVTGDDQNNQIKSLFQDELGFLWIGTWEDGLYQTSYTGGDLSLVNTFLFKESENEGIIGNIIYSISQDINGKLWIGTPYGLSILEKPHSPETSFHSYKYQFGSQEGLSNNEVWKIFRDRSGIMWLGTLEGGINMAHPNGRIFETFRIPPLNQQIQSQTTVSFTFDPDNQLLVGVKSLGFGYYDLQQKKYTPYTADPRFNKVPRDINTVNCFLRYGQKMWMGTRYNGIGIFDYETKEFSSLQPPQLSYDITFLFASREGKVWAGASDGLFRISEPQLGTSDIEVELIEAFNNIRVSSICEDDSGTIWISTAENGIFRLSQTENEVEDIKIYKMGENSPSDELTSLFYDRDHILWAGTKDKGLLRYNQDKNCFVGVEALPGLSEASIMGIIDDAEGSLWVTSNNGIARITFFDGKIKSDKFSISDGLQGNRFLPNSICKLKDNRILMGGYYGFNAFYPEGIEENDYIPPTVLTGVEVNNTPFDYRKNLNRTFKHDESSLTFKYSSLSYYKSKKNIFSYKLEGLDEHWTMSSASNREVRYPKIPPGEYNFLVRSANSSELWNEEAVSFKFRILPAPYKTWWAFTVYFLLFMSIALLLFRYQLQKQKIIRDLEVEKIRHEKTEKLNDYKLHFFTNISHEILTPLSILMGAVSILKRKTRKGQDEIELMERNLLGLNILLRQLLDFRKMERGHLNLRVRKGDLVDVINSLIRNFKPLVQSKKLQLSFDAPEECICYFDEDKLKKICTNLISNAVKYNVVNGKVLIRLLINMDRVTLSIEDTGPGISEEELKGIFKRFYRVEKTRRESGTGIGLALVQNLVKLHKGKIEVDSTLGEGTVFTIELPVDKGSFQDHEFEHDQLDRLKEEEEELIVPQLKDISILLVEDNADFRKILKTHLETHARVIESGNGEDALRKAVKYAPSIVVSDVMMPNMDGFELCVQLKSNVDTQNIPVILLTAKTTDNDRARGYDCGADSYITKPVSLSVLQTRINALLLNKKDKASLPENYNAFHAPNKAMGDELFLQKLEEMVETRLSDTRFKIPDMHQPFGMSSSAFFRRVKRLTNKSPVEYVRTLRINRAALLLAKRELTISEIAYNTGFSDQSYFGSCFKKQMGMTPSEYVKNKS